MNLTIRNGAPSDAARLAELAAGTFHDTFAPHNDPKDLALYLTEAYGAIQQGQELADPNVTTLLVEAGDQLVAYAQLRRGAVPECVTGDAPMELWRFYVAREHHGQGIAQQLMRRVELEAHQARARTLWLGVWEHNERAKAFYGKHAFVDVGSHVFVLGNDPQTDRIMARTV